MVRKVQTTTMRPTNLAHAIAAGLIGSGRAESRECHAGDVLRLECRRGGYYWVAFSGAELLHGPTLRDAEPLQSTFVAAMAAAGLATRNSPSSRPRVRQELAEWNNGMRWLRRSALRGARPSL